MSEDILKQIKGVSSDSRLIKKDYAYIAIRGATFNGESFIDEAIANGANYVIIQSNEELDKKDGVIFVYVDNPRQSLSCLASAFYAPQPQNIVAITGTNGKTSTANFFMQLAHLINYKSAAIGTLGLTSLDSLTGLEQFLHHDSALTSPDSVTTNKILYNLAKENFTHVALEASSHGLSQYRLDGINFKAAAFTNLSRDHLDYHGTMAAYFNAKKRLFSEIVNDKTVIVLNTDIPEFNELDRIVKERGLKSIEYGKNARDIRLLECKNNILNFNFFGKAVKAEINLTGEFQFYNMLCAVGLSVAAGLEEERILKELSNLKLVPGRMEKVASTKSNNDIYVDYAHTPDALSKVLGDLKQHCKGRLILVFGCGGDRDHGKREVMGIIAEKFTDIVIITDDNPRNEDPQTIRNDVMRSMKNPIEIGDREEAIAYAISILKKDDNILIAGKGHEEYQIIGDKKVPSSDKKIVVNILGIVRHR